MCVEASAIVHQDFGDLETTADGNKGESGGRDQRVKAFLRVDDKK
jgi:hypothetical protein